MSPPQDNHKDVTVIVGGGVIGLCAAYNLAKRSPASSPNVEIKVVEACKEPFSAASSNCTGCFHYELLAQPLVPLGKYSFELWEASAEEAGFKTSTGYRPRSSFGIERGSGRDLDQLPDWIRTETSCDVDMNVLGTHTATVNPAGVGDWLRKQCRELGVHIITDLNAVSVCLSAGKQVQSVICWHATSHKSIELDCKQLLIACGPWTPSVYETLFPSSPIQLQSTTDAGDWITFRNPCPATSATTAFVSFASLVNEKMEFAARNDGTIWACGRRNFTAALPHPCQARQPDETIIQELNDDARRWINWRCGCDEKHVESLEVVSKGRDFRPATPSGLPVIAEIASSLLTGVGSNGEDKVSSGVFVCWGHGSYGLTLGMGSGRLVSQLMHGETPDIDISPFSVDFRMA